MGDLQKEFYVTLPSSACMNIYPKNTLSDFYVELATPIDLKGREYLVALVEVVFEGVLAKVIDGVKLSYLDTNEIAPIAEIKDPEYKNSSAYIYSNICEPQYFGGQMLKLLKKIMDNI